MNTPVEFNEANDALNRAELRGLRLFLFKFGRGHETISWGKDYVEAVGRLNAPDKYYEFFDITYLLGSAVASQDHYTEQNYGVPLADTGPRGRDGGPELGGEGG